MNQRGAIHENCLAARNAGNGIRAVPLVSALGVESIYGENATASYPFTRSTEPFYDHSLAALRKPASYTQIRQAQRCPAAGRQCRRYSLTSPDPGARTDVARPPIATTPEPAPMSPDLWHRDPRARADVARPPAAATPGPFADRARPTESNTTALRAGDSSILIQRSHASRSFCRGCPRRHRRLPVPSTVLKQAPKTNVTTER
jgi:hypothetical protein